MIGFGFIDQTVMLQAGNAIDCTLGVTFGLSTLTAAAFGQVCSDASGVLFGGTLDRVFAVAGLPTADLTSRQRHLPIVARTKVWGSFVGVIVGCCLGLVNLLFIDTERSATLKLQAFNEEQEFEFTIEASNALRPGMTALTVRGPDVDGLLASMSAALSVRGCSLVEFSGKRIAADDENEIESQQQQQQQTDGNVMNGGAGGGGAGSGGGGGGSGGGNKFVEDLFLVTKRETGEAFDNEELEELARGLLDSTRTPMNVNSVKAAMHELENTNAYLKQRIQKLEQVMYTKQITVIPSDSA